jgi:STE24 endopeptidase
MRHRTVILLLLFSVAAAELCSSAPNAPVVPVAAKPSAHFDVDAATNAWLATVPAASRARSGAYFEGGYWLMLWDFLYLVGIMILLLETPLSARMRDVAERVARLKPLQSFLYWIEFLALTSVLTFPLTVYESFFREHQYGLSNQGFGSWFRDQLISLAIGLILGGIGFIIVMAIVRRLPRTWHWWGAAVSVVFFAFIAMIAPVLLFPLFNTFTPLPDGALKREILSMARANGIPARDVYEVNASRQSKRVSANVSGFLGTERISLNDNLLNRCSPEAVLSVMGHEMGHYVMHHILNAILFAAIALTILFGVLRWVLDRALRWRGERWRVQSIGDAAVLPLATLILAVISFITTPIGNSFTRMQEYEADIFGLNAARQPDGEAEVDLLLGEYRKLSPGPLEEMLFFDHPSGRTRIHAAMRWKAENLCLFDAKLPCAAGPARERRSVGIRLVDPSGTERVCLMPKMPYPGKYHR